MPEPLSLEVPGSADARAAGDGISDVAAPPRAGSIADEFDETRLLAPVYPLPRIELVSGRGARVTDRQGREYLDFVSGIGVNALGHAPPGLRKAVTGQMQRLVHQSNLYGNPPARKFAGRLLEATGYDRVFFCNSGTEAVEAALKFARARANRQGGVRKEVVAFTGGFHGRSAFALSVTSNPTYREPFLPLVPGIRFAPFNDPGGLEEAITEHTAAVIVEPVQGEAGAVPADPDFLKAVQVRTVEVGATLIFDEVQCGMGRTGRLLAAENFGVRADITVLSKAIAGGLPFGAVLVTEEVAGCLEPGMHGSTFGGNPVAAAAALHVLDKVNRPRFLAAVRKSGTYLKSGLKALARKHSSVLGEARGAGLLLAVELAEDAPIDAAALVAAALHEGLLLVRGGSRAIRFLPPLNVTAKEIDEALSRFDRAIGRALAAGPTVRHGDDVPIAKGEER